MKANFDNQETDFHIDRKDIPYIEHSLQRGLYDVLQDAVGGRWTFNDVAAVVSYAMHGPSKDDRAAIGLVQAAARMGFPIAFSRRYRPHPKVVEVLERDGHGNFADLMASILSEAIFGETAATDEPEAVDAAA